MNMSLPDDLRAALRELDEALAAEGEPPLLLEGTARTLAVRDGSGAASPQASGLAHRPQRAKRFDWDLAVEMLAHGISVDQVAVQLGCNRSSVFRALRRSPGLRARLEAMVNNGRQAAAGRVHAQAERIADALVLAAVKDRSPGVLVHLSKSLGLASWSLTQRAGYTWPGLRRDKRSPW